MALRGLARAAFAFAAALALAGCVSNGPVLQPLIAGHYPATVDLDDTPFFPQTRYECGPAALATVLSASGVAVTPDELASEVYIPGRHGSLQPELVASARRHDRLPYVPPPSIESLLTSLSAGVPVLVLQKLGFGPFPGWHYAVVVGYDAAKDRFLLRSGTDRRKLESARYFLATWVRAGSWALLVLEPGVLPPDPDLARYMEAAAGLEAVGRADAAAAAYEVAVRQWPTAALPRFALANLALARGDLAAAEQGFRSAANLDPDDAAAHNNRAEVLRRMGCSAAARAEIDRARALAGDGALAATVEDTAREVAAMPPGDAAGCPDD
jgi:hypothetical protein